MKNQTQKNELRIKVIILIGFLFTQSFLLNSSFPQNNENLSDIPNTIKENQIPKNAANHDPIYIDGNAELDAFCFGNDTDGTKFNPHVIQDLVIDCHNLENSFTIINTDKYLDIVNCTFFNGEDFAGLYINNCKNIWVEDAIIYSQHFGIELRGAEDITILTCFLHDNWGGMIISGGNYNTIYGNQVWGNGWGIYLFSAPNNTLKLNYIHDNDSGFYLKYSNDNFFQYNTLSHIEGDGFYLYQSNFNEFADNDVEYNDVFFFYDCSGFNLDYSHNNSFYNNSVRNNMDPGFRLEDSSNNTIENNEIIDNFGGISVRDSHDIKIINNIISQNGIYVRYSYDIDIFNNIILGGTSHGIEVSYSSDIDIFNNTSSENRFSGLRFYRSNSSVIENNEFNKNQYGIDFLYSNDSTLYYNWCLLNREAPSKFTECHNIVFINSPPEIADLHITPSNPCRNDNLFVSYEFQDCEEDPEGNTEIKWYKNNILQPTYNDQKNISGSITDSGDIWKVSVTPHDGTLSGSQKNYSVEIIDNERPIATEALLNNNLSRIGFYSNLSLSYVYFDNDGDIEVDTIIYWYKNNNIQPEYNNSLTVNHSATDEGDTWQASIQVFDGISYGEIIWSNAIQINYIPYVAIYFWPNNPSTLEFLYFGIYFFTDEDGDTVSIIPESIKWFRDGVYEVVLSGYSENSISIDSIYTACFQQWHVEFNYSDGYDNFTIVTENITVINSKPSISSIVFDPSKPSNNNDLTVSYEFWDNDDHPENGTEILWYLNNVLMAQYNNTKTIPKSVLVDGDIWCVTVCPFDGYDYGDLYEVTFIIGVGPPDEESNKVNGYSITFTIFFISISVIGLITNRKKKIE